MFIGKVRIITRPGTLVLIFLKTVHLLERKMNANECKVEAKPRNSEVR